MSEVREFDCTECGRHIVSLMGPRPALDGSDRCAACWSIPGWYDNPELARILDPDMPLGGWRRQLQ